MVLLKNTFKKLIVSMLVVILLVFFSLSPYAEAKLKLEEGEFYYAGTSDGAYVVSEGIFSWLLSKIGEIADFLLGLFTMGGRMVLVGWTAIFEKLLTWILESSTGIPMQPDEINSTDLKENTDSANNVTLEAIVYNQVPIFDINFFEDDIKRCTSGTGRYFVKCETCAELEDPEGFCRMRVCECENCKQIMEDSGYFDNAVVLIKENIRVWYYTIRMAAMAAMLCVLIFIGIKSAISSVAQNKAMYKKMFWDWVVGMILIFSVHYIMVVIINFNEYFIDIIKGVETGVTEITKKEFNVQTKRYEDLEIGIYEAVRTRAYDAKLINGTTGTLLYMTLVYYAFKFSIKYLKRYFTVIVLTIIGPIIAFTYAMQKALFGKSKSFSQWLSEYFINVFIQSIHALIYTSFISIALIISLNSVSGMILAFVFVNFMDKAEPLFRKIFKFGGNGSLVDDVLKDEKPQELLAQAVAAKNIMDMGGKLKDSKFIPEKMKQLSISNLAKAPWKWAGTNLVLGAARLKDIYDNKNPNREYDKQRKKSLDLLSITVEINRKRQEMNGKKSERFDNFINHFNTESDVVTLDEETAIEEQLEMLEQQALSEGNEQLYNELSQIRARFEKATNVSSWDVVKAQMSSMLDMNNFYEKYEPTEQEIENQMDKHGEGSAFKRDSQGRDLEDEDQYEARRNRARAELKKKKKWKRKSNYTEYDETLNKDVKKKMSDLVAKQFSADNIFGENKDIVMETLQLSKNTLLGMGSLFLGFATVVAEPAVGMGLIGNGILKGIEFSDEMGFLDPNARLNYQVQSKRYSFNRFERGAKGTIVKEVMKRADRAKDELVVKNVRENHSKLYQAMKIGGAGLTIAGMLGGATVSLPIAAAGATIHYVGKSMGKFAPYGNDTIMGRLNQKHFKALNKAKKSFMLEEVKDSSKETEAVFARTYAELMMLSSATSQQPVPEVSEEQEERMIKAGDAVITESGDVVILRQSKLPEQKLVEQAVAEIVIRDIAKTEITMSYFKSEKVKDDIKRSLKNRLQEQNATKEEIDKIFTDINSKIEKAAEKIMKEENVSASEEPLPVSEQADRTEVSAGLTTVDEVLMQQIVREQIEAKHIKSASEISSESVIAEFSARKQQMVNAQSSKVKTRKTLGAFEEMRAGYEGTTLENAQPQEAVLFGVDAEQAQAPEQTTKQKTETIAKTVEEMRRSVARKSQPYDGRDRKAVFDQLLMDVAQSATQTGSNVAEQKKTNETLDQLFATKEERDKAKVLVNSIRTMKRLNTRAEGLKMKSSAPDYTAAKAKQQQGVSANVGTADKTYTGTDGSRTVSRVETYGPATDIVDLIRKTTTGTK